MKPVDPSDLEGDAARDGLSRTAEPRSSGKFRVAVPIPLAAERVDLQPCILLCLPENSARVDLARTLRESGRAHVVECEPANADGAELLATQELDIAVLHASHLNLNCAALAHDPRFGFPELVFAVDERQPAQRLALLSRGCRHVVSSDHLSTWLRDQLPSLCTLARARRIVLGACSATTPAVELTLDIAGAENMNLHVAETQFRETFLRSVLAEHGSRRQAAKAAGVPYRSFCEMLRKLGI